MSTSKEHWAIISLRLVTPLMVGIILWIVACMYSNMQHIQHNMVYKCDYAEDLEYTRQCIEQMSERIDSFIDRRN